MAKSYLLTAQNITATTAELLVTEDVSPFNPASGITVTMIGPGGTTIQGTTNTNGIAAFTGLTPLYTYIAWAANSAKITFTTLEDTTPKTATASQWQDLIAKVKNKATITMTDTDPGEGSALAANSYVAVYGGDSIILDYSTNEVNTGTKWIDGKTIYKKTVQIASLPNATSTGYPHGVSNLETVVEIKGVHRAGAYAYDLSAPGIGGSQYGLQLSVDATNIYVNVGTDRHLDSADITIYYTKSN